MVQNMVRLLFSLIRPLCPLLSIVKTLDLIFYSSECTCIEDIHSWFNIVLNISTTPSFVSLIPSDYFIVSPYTAWLGTGLDISVRIWWDAAQPKDTQPSGDCNLFVKLTPVQRWTWEAWETNPRAPPGPRTDVIKELKDIPLGKDGQGVYLKSSTCGPERRRLAHLFIQVNQLVVLFLRTITTVFF